MSAAELVYTVDDYYDGPRSGIADYQGVPHLYRSLYLDSEVWNPNEDRFELSPVTESIRDLAVEAFDLWQRWQVAELAGTAPRLDPDAARVLPEDSARYAELKAILEPQLRIDPARRLVRRGILEGESPEGRPMSGLTVRWLSVE